MKLYEATQREELDEITHVIHSAYHDPPTSIRHLLEPVYGHPAANPLECLTAAQERRWVNHCNNEASHWIYVKDEVSGRIIGAAQWLFYTKNPFPNGIHALPAPWWPEGEGREFTEHVLAQLARPRQIFMQRPHAGIHGMSVLPEFRRRGVASMMMEWGIRRIDKKNFECFIESTDTGRWLYERYNARKMLSVFIDTDERGKGNEWRALRLQFGNASIMHLMWRPKQGLWIENGLQGPWDIQSHS